MLIISAAALLRLVFAAIIPLFPDEAYYWDWSRHLAPGYFDHPGGIALAIRLGGLMLAPFDASATSVGVRLGAIAAGWIASLATIATARRLAGDAAGLRAAIIMSVLPLAAAGLILATPDAPLLAAVAVGLYFVVRALEEPVRSRASLRWWMLAGVALGAAFSSKYTSIFVPAGVVIAIVARRSLRPRLAEPGPYVACAIATLIFLPVLIWNANHDWISFVFQIRHGLARPEGSALRAAWRHEGDFFGGQAALASPILFVMFGMAAWRALRPGVIPRPSPVIPSAPLVIPSAARNLGPGATISIGGRDSPVAALRRNDADIRFVLAVVAFVSFGFFTYSALRQRVEPNWPAPAYIPAIVLLATAPWSMRAGKWLRAGTVFGAVMSLLIYIQGVTPILPIAPRKDPIGRAFGWNDVARAAQSAAVRVTAETNAPAWIAGDRYQEAAELAIHVPSHPPTFATNQSGRVNQYDLWPRFPDRAKKGDNLVLVLDDSDEAEPHEAIRALAPHFVDARRGELVRLQRGDGVIATRRVWTLLGWRGTWPAAR